MPTLEIPGSFGYSGGAGSASAASASLAIPWLDYASCAMPDNHEMIMWWAMYLWLTNGTLRTAFGRVADHFITDITFPDLTSDNENKFKELFTKHLNYRRELKTLAEEFLCFGNVFVTIFTPFHRYLSCQGCNFETLIQKAKYKPNFDKHVTWQRKEACEMCGNAQPFRCQDRKSDDISRIRVVRFSPFEIKLAQNYWSQRKEIYWKIPNQRRQDIKGGAPIHVEDTPMPVLEAVAAGADLKFDEDQIFHLDETVISGMDTRGWGVPKVISNFRTAWMQQTTNRADQAIAMDYTLGIRVLSPTAPAGDNDPMITAGADEFATRMEQIINKHRTNPASYSVVPYPVNYQMLGGEGENLLPADKLKFRQQELLSECAIPLEYHQMTMTTQAAPMMLQLFEASWQSIPSLYNTILTWMVKVVARNFSLKETTAVMKKTTIAFDETRKQLLMQLMAAQQISPETALSAIGLDASKEIELTLRHQDTVARKTQEHQEQQQDLQDMAAIKATTGMPTAGTAAQGAQGGAGGAPPGGAPGGGTPDNSLQGMSDQAQSAAQQLVSMPEGDRKRQLGQIRKTNPTLHALVTSAMEKLRSAAASQGKQQLLQPPPGGGGTAQPQ